MIRNLQIEWMLFIDGSNQALGEVYKAHYSSMLGVAYYYFKDNTVSEDLVADVFAKLLSLTVSDRDAKLKNVNEKLETFLQVLTKNKCLDHLRKEKNRKTILTSIFESFNRSYTNDAFLNQDMQLMLGVLPNRQRQVLDLHLKGYTNDEISDQLGISYNTCRNTLSSAKKRIKQLWQIFMT